MRRKETGPVPSDLERPTPFITMRRNEMTAPDRPAPAVTTALSESAVSEPEMFRSPEKPPQRSDANLRLIRSRLADEERMRPKRWWKFLS